jgi:hypothetical protein
MLGVNCHFANEFGNHKSFLSPLPEQSSPHSGVNIAEDVAVIIHHSNLRDKISYFMTDYATNSETCLKALDINFELLQPLYHATQRLEG